MLYNTLMSTESRSCQNCKQSFELLPEDFTFYERISVPPPTFCPECRLVRRMSWRNERTLFRGKCALTGKDVITCFAPESGITVYDRDTWWGDGWDALTYGRDYDFSKPFFTQFNELLRSIPMPSLFNSRSHQTVYANHTGEVKNAYMVSACWGGENFSYCNKAIRTKDSTDILGSRDCELSYEVIGSVKIYKSAFIQDSEHCSDCWFLYECRGCTNCFGCTNLRNKSYYIFNQPYSKEEYQAKLASMKLDTRAGLEAAQKEFETLKAKALRKYAAIYNCQNVTGDNLSNVANAKDSFDVEDCRDVRFAINAAQKLTDSYDAYGVGENAELVYESLDTGINSSMFLFDIFVWGGHNVSYGYACHGSQNLFGCIGLHKKQYCIFNKQYSKEEYEALIPKIIEQMKMTPYVDARGRSHGYGEFFPTELSPFAYNETIAQEYFPLSAQAAQEQGYAWREASKRDYTPTITVDTLPDTIEAVQDSVVSEVIECAHKGSCAHQCPGAFRVIPQELGLYRRLYLPLPRLCANCRHYERLAKRNPMKLWTRNCMCEAAGVPSGGYSNTVAHRHHEAGQACPNSFVTPYAPERPETVYCEPCYLAEVG